jgi:ERCC4-type nuclease
MLWQLLAGIGCIQDVSNASEEEILRISDLSVEKARTIVTFFNSNVSQRAPPYD